MSDLATLTTDGDIGIITINNPPVNALSPGVPEGVEAAIATAATDDSIRAVVMIGAGRTFSAGADIKEFEKITSGERPGLNLLPMLIEVEDCPKVVVMAIHGTALGGGLEIAMAGHYRVAAASAQVGQPEVKLGLIPGAGGTQRLPRLAGVAKAVEMCVSGEPISAQQALQCAIIDRIVEGDLLAGAISFAREVAAKGRKLPKTRERIEKLGTESANAGIFAAARKTQRQRARGQLAPLAAVGAVEAATYLPFEEGCKKEGELFRQCLFSDQSKALIHVFLGERTASKVPNIPKSTPVVPIRKAAVVGADTMGVGIAMVYANVGIPVLVQDISQGALDEGLATIRRSYATSVKKGRLTQDFVDRRLELIQPTLGYDGFEGADIIVEAVHENMQLKKQVFAELDQVAKPDAILASNTSGLNIDEIAVATKRPDVVIGYHFFRPANVTRLLEIVRGKDTRKEVIASSIELAKKLKKIAVLVRNGRGFVAYRMFDCYRREAVFLVEEGATPQQVDDALYEFGMAMGPLAASDLAGLDVFWRIRKEDKQLHLPGVRFPVLEDLLCERGRLGQKTRSGWYHYDEHRKPSPDPEVEKMAREYAAKAAIPQRKFTPPEIVERLMYALINEGAKILEEGIALRAIDIDIIYVYGYGFPAWRGGPMWHADTLGLKKVYKQVCYFREQHGNHWTPASLLKELAEGSMTFTSL